ncbi:MAG: FAD-dependent oxidoreductase [Chloroflexi bacterium]|nr:MAG: FAD-dependent oxidoreductase [Chloroflexota bacterium]
MLLNRRWDAIVVGAGPNGLAAAVTIAQAGKSVLVLEAQATPGGGSRTAESTLPGFRHDVCSAVHPLGVASPVFRRLGISDAVEWVYPEVELAHPLDGGHAGALYRSIDATAAGLGRDGVSWQNLFTPLVSDLPRLTPLLLGPFRLPRHPIAAARFGLRALRSVRGLAHAHFQDDTARALFAGMAAHAMLRLEQPASAAFGLVLGAFAHAVGWPVARGGSQAIIDALTTKLREHGGEIVLNQPVVSLDDLPESRVVLLDVTPRQALAIGARRFPAYYRRQLGRFRYGPGVCKVDWALSAPVPWQAPAARKAITLHLGGTLDEISRAEIEVHHGHIPEQPYVLISQPTIYDATRAPAGRHTLWAYCHVPAHADEDMSERIEAQIERFAPGFRERILARNVLTAIDMQEYNANYIGGDINGGIQDLRQVFTRPTPRRTPYITGAKGIYLCSSSTPPGGGVHGMCGYHAARLALRDLR